MPEQTPAPNVPNTSTNNPPSNSPVNPPIEERKSSSFFSQHKFTVISVFILVLALIPLLLLLSMQKKQMQQGKLTNTTVYSNSPTTQPAVPTPTTVPLTVQNSQPTIDQATQQIQSSLDQSQSEINSVNSINSSNDSTTGL